MPEHDPSKPPPGPWVMFVGISRFAFRPDGLGFDIQVIHSLLPVHRPASSLPGGELAITLSMLIIVHHDEPLGYDIVVRGVDTEGHQVYEGHGVVPIDADGSHQYIHRDFDFHFNRGGRYWFDVYADDRWLARTVLRIQVIGEEPELPREPPSHGSRR